jgi:hypothetical protein
MRVLGSDESDDLDGMSRREPLNVARQALHRRAYSDARQSVKGVLCVKISVLLTSSNRTCVESRGITYSGTWEVKSFCAACTSLAMLYSRSGTLFAICPRSS